MGRNKTHIIFCPILTQEGDLEVRADESSTDASLGTFVLGDLKYIAGFTEEHLTCRTRAQHPVIMAAETYH